MDRNTASECMQSTLDYIDKLEAENKDLQEKNIIQENKIKELQEQIIGLTGNIDKIPEGAVCYFKNDTKNNMNKTLVWSDKANNGNDAVISFLDFVDGNASGQSGWTERGLQLNSKSNLDMPYVKAKTIEINVNCLNWNLRKASTVIKAITKEETEFIMKSFNWGYLTCNWYNMDETTVVAGYQLSDSGKLPNNDDEFHSIVFVFHNTNEISCYIDGQYSRKVVEKNILNIEGIKIYSSSKLYPDLPYESVAFYEKELTSEEIKNNYENYKKKNNTLNGNISDETQFSTVSDMKNANLLAGSIVSTLGYYSENDGGGAKYSIKTKDEYFNELPDDCKYVEISAGVTIKNYGDDYGNHKLKNGLVAKLKIENLTTTPEQWGAKGNGINSDTEALICMLALTKSGMINFKENSVYLIANRTVNERSKYIDNRFCLSMLGTFTGGCQKPLIANCSNLILNGNGCTLRIPDDNFGSDSMGMLCLGGIIDGLDINGFNFDSNGLTMKSNNKSSNHTIVYAPGTINSENSEISNLNIHNNIFLANGTMIDIKDGGGDHILLINPSTSHDVYIENNEFYDWGRWVFAVDLGGTGERFYNYKFNGNKCIQTDNNKLESGAFRGLGWIDFEAKKCWTNLEVCNNTVEGLVGFAMNGNDKVLENFKFSNNTITRLSRSYRSAYPYFFEFYYVRTAKDTIMEDNLLNQPYSATPSAYCLHNFTFRNNQVRSGGVLNINGIYGDIIIDNNIVEDNRRLVNFTGRIPSSDYKLAFPPYIDPDIENGECNFIFTNNSGGIIGSNYGKALLMNPKKPGLYSNLKIKIEGNKTKDLLLTAFDSEYEFDLNKNNIISDSTLALQGANFISKTIFNPINNPIIGCAKYKEGDLIVDNVSMGRMELCPKMYTDYIKIGKKYNVYCKKEGYFPQMYIDSMLYSNQKIYFGKTYYTETNLYMALNDGNTGDSFTMPNHTSGIKKYGDIEFLWVASLGEISVKEI